MATTKKKNTNTLDTSNSIVKTLAAKNIAASNAAAAKKNTTSTNKTTTTKSTSTKSTGTSASSSNKSSNTSIGTKASTSYANNSNTSSSLSNNKQTTTTKNKTVSRGSTAGKAASSATQKKSNLYMSSEEYTPFKAWQIRQEQNKTNTGSQYISKLVNEYAKNAQSAARSGKYDYKSYKDQYDRINNYLSKYGNTQLNATDSYNAKKTLNNAYDQIQSVEETTKSLMPGYNVSVNRSTPQSKADIFNTGAKTNSLLAKANAKANQNVQDQADLYYASIGGNLQNASNLQLKALQGKANYYNNKKAEENISKAGKNFSNADQTKAEYLTDTSRNLADRSEREEKLYNYLNSHGYKTSEEEVSDILNNEPQNMRRNYTISDNTKKIDYSTAANKIQNELDNRSFLLKYADLYNNDDWNENNSYDSAASSKNKYLTWHRDYPDALKQTQLTDDEKAQLFFDSVNGDERAYNALHTAYTSDGTPVQLATNGSGVEKYMTDDEVKMFTYLYNSDAANGKELAMEYYNGIEDTLNQRLRAAEQAQLAEDVKDPLKAAEYSLLSVATQPFAAAANLAMNASDLITKGKIDANDPRRTYAQEGNIVRSLVSDEIKNSLGGEGSFLGDLASLGYEAAMSALDNVYGLGIGQKVSSIFGLTGNAASRATENIVLGLMGTSSAASSIQSNLEAGMDTTSAITLGVGAGAIEVITEKIGMDNLFNSIWKGKTAWVSWAKQVLSEGSEEVLGSAMNDALGLTYDAITGESKSDFNREINQYILENGLGMNAREEAFQAVLQDHIQDALRQGAAGGISGGMLGSLALANSLYVTNNTVNSINVDSSDTESVRAFAMSAIESSETSSKTNEAALELLKTLPSTNDTPAFFTPQNAINKVIRNAVVEGYVDENGYWGNVDAKSKNTELGNSMGLYNEKNSPFYNIVGTKAEEAAELAQRASESDYNAAVAEAKKTAESVRTEIYKRTAINEAENAGATPFEAKSMVDAFVNDGLMNEKIRKYISDQTLTELNKRAIGAKNNAFAMDTTNIPTDTSTPAKAFPMDTAEDDTSTPAKAFPTSENDDNTSSAFPVDTDKSNWERSVIDNDNSTIDSDSEAGRFVETIKNQDLFNTADVIESIVDENTSTAYLQDINRLVAATIKNDLSAVSTTALDEDTRNKIIAAVVKDTSVSSIPGASLESDSDSNKYYKGFDVTRFNPSNNQYFTEDDGQKLVKDIIDVYTDEFHAPQLTQAILDNVDFDVADPVDYLLELSGAAESIKNGAKPQEIKYEISNKAKMALYNAYANDKAKAAIRDTAETLNVNNKEENGNGGELSVSGIGGRTDVQNTGVKGSGVVSNSGRAQETGRIFNADARLNEINSIKRTGQRQTAYELGLANGSKGTAVNIISNDSNADTRAAAQYAAEHGYNLVTFADNSLKFFNGAVSARGMFDAKTKTVYARADHRGFNAQQISRHEICHGYLSTDKEAKINRLMKNISQAIGTDNLKAVMKMYNAAYNGSNLTEMEVIEEMLCDFNGQMNIFSGVLADAPAIRETYNRLLEIVSGETEKDNAFESKKTLPVQQKFSMETPIEQTNNLIALHNLTEVNLKKDIKLGGFPAPSIAVTGADVGHTDFGDISLIMNKSSVDPESNLKNQTYSADIWSPTVPTLEYEANPKVEKKIHDMYYDVMHKFGESYARPFYSVANTLEDTLNRNNGIEGIITSLKNDPEAKNFYLAVTQGRVIKPTEKTVVTKMSNEKVQLAKNIIDIVGAENLPPLVWTPWIRKNENFIKNTVKEYLIKSGKNHAEIENILNKYSIDHLAKRYISPAVEYKDKGAERTTVETDYATQRNIINNTVDQNEYEKWLNSVFAEAKPMRVVGFDEVLAAVLPSDVDSDLTDQLREVGVNNILSYEAGNYADRLEKINSVENAKFSRELGFDSTDEQLTPAQHEYFKDSKIRDENGNLKIMYHASPNNFTTFDIKKAKSSGRYGKGFYFSDNAMSGYGGKVYETYLNITNPIKFKNAEIISESQIKNLLQLLADDEDYGIENYGYGQTVESITDSLKGKDIYMVLQDINATCVGDFVQTVKLLNQVNGTNYDGIIAPTETVAFYPEQIKLVNNQNPTSDTDIRKSREIKFDSEQAKTIKKAASNIKFESTKYSITTAEAKKIAREIIKESASSVKPESISADIQYLTTKITEEYSTFDDVKADLMPIARKIVENASITDGFDDLQQTRNEIRNTKLFVSQKVKKDFTDYNEIRKSHFGSVSLSLNSGKPLTDFADEMYDAYGSVFDIRDMTESDQLQYILDFVDNNKAKKINPFEGQIEEAAQFTAEQLYDSMLNAKLFTPTELKSIDSLYAPDRWTSILNKGSKKTAENIMPLSDIIAKLRHEYNINITVGHVARGARATYNRKTKGIRTTIANHLPDISHEFGHAIDNKYSIIPERINDLPKDLVKELRACLGANLAAEYSAAEHPFEGLAEYIRKYWLNKDEATAKYPTITKWLMNKLPGKDRMIFEQFAEEINGYFAFEGESATDVIRLAEEGGKDFRTTMEKIKDKCASWYRSMVDAQAPLKEFDRATGSNVYRAAINSQYSDAIAGEIILGDLTDINGQYVAPGLSSALEGIQVQNKKEYREFGEYLVCKHAPEWIADNKTVFASEVRNNIEWVTNRAVELERKYPKFKEAAEKLYKFQTDLMKTWGIQTDILDADLYARLQKKYPNYVPMFRAKAKGGKNSTHSARRGFANQNTPIKIAKGSGLDIIHPVDSITANIAVLVNAGKRNDVMIQLTNAAEQLGANANYMEKINTPMVGHKVFGDTVKQGLKKNAKEVNLNIDNLDDIIDMISTDMVQFEKGRARGDVVTVLKKGKQEFWKINDPALLESVASLTPKKLSGLLNAYAKTTRFLTANITGNNPVWSIFSNAPRDLGTFIGYFPNKKKLGQGLRSIASAYVNSFKANKTNGSTVDPLYREYLAMGGGHTSMYSADTDLAKKARKHFSQTKAQKVWEMLNPLEWLTFLTDTIEQGPRYATYRTLRLNGVDQHEAFYQAMDITTNFRKAGNMSREINKVVPFFNASIQGVDKFARYFSAADVKPADRAKTVRTRVGIYAAVSAALAGIFYALNCADPDREKEYEQLSSYTKNNFWLFPMGDGKYFAIPKPRELAVLTSLFERLLETTAGENDHAFDDFYGYAVDNFLPSVLSDVAELPAAIIEDGLDVAVSDTTLGILGNMGIFGVGVDLAANKDFLGRSIESTSLQNYEAKDRYTDATSWVAKAIGSAFNLSPQKIDYAGNNILGYIWKIQKALFPVGESKRDLTLGVANSYVKDNLYSTDITNWIYDKADKSSLKANSNPTDAEIQYTAKMDSNMTSFYGSFNGLNKGNENTANQRAAKQTVADMIYEYQRVTDKNLKTDAEKAVIEVIKESDGDTSNLPAVMSTYVKDAQKNRYDLTDAQYVEYQTMYNAEYWNYIEEHKDNLTADIMKEAKSAAKTNATNAILKSLVKDSESYKETYNAVTSTSTYKNASSSDKENIEELIDEYAVYNSNWTTSAHEAIDAGVMTATEYILFMNALQKNDQPTEKGVYGTYTKDEQLAAIADMKWSDAKASSVWEYLPNDSKNPYTDGKTTSELLEKTKKQLEKVKEEQAKEKSGTLSSSFLGSYTYKDGVLNIQVSGTWYKYNISEATFNGLINADSPGRYFNTYIG